MKENISKKIFESDLIKHLLEGTTDAEKEGFAAWVKEYISPLDQITIGIDDMLSTEKTSEELFDAINSGIFRPPEDIADAD